MRLLVLLAGAALFSPMAASAATPAAGVRIERAAARVVVIPEQRADVVVQIRQGRAELPPLKLRRQGQTQVVEGGLAAADWKPGWLGGDGCSGEGKALQVRYKGRTVPVADLPVITVRTPVHANVMADGMIFGEVGPAQSLYLSSKGCGAWRAAATTGDLTIDNAGAADIQAGGMRGALTIRLTGAGDVTIPAGWTPVLVVRSKGSGDINYRGDTGRVDVQLDGKGDVILAKVFGALNARVPGGGDFKYIRK